jgi:hypothetical protein
MLFAEGDDGLEYLRNRLDRRVRETTATGVITIREIAEIDHAMHRAWLRPAMFAAIEDAARPSLARPTPGIPQLEVGRGERSSLTA